MEIEEQAGGQGKKLTKFQLRQIKSLHDQNHSAQQISEKMNISLFTTYRVIKLGFQYQKKVARQSIYYEDKKSIIIEAAEQNRNMTASEIAGNIELNAKGVSPLTQERILNNAGLIYRRKRLMQDFSDSNKEERYRISKIYSRMSQAQHRKIYYSDESHIYLQQNGLQFVRKQDSECWDDEKFRKFSSVHPISVNIWKLISYQGTQVIHWSADFPWINGNYYREEILQKYILNNPHLKQGSEYQRCFQQDLARAHQAKETLDLLEKHSINVAEWPPQGADLSPIELCFGEMQRRSKKLYSQIKSKEDLWNL